MDLLMLADPSEPLVRDYLARGESYVLVDTNNEVFGIYVLLPTRPHTCELVNVAVAEHGQGKGYGKQLIFHAIQVAREAAYATIEVGTGNSSINQIAFYQKCGFRMSHIDHNFFLRHYDEAIYENGLRCVDMVRFTLDL